MGNRRITWRRWTTYLVSRLLLAAFTIAILEAASETGEHGFVWLALVPAILVLLIPYRVPHQRRNPGNMAGVASVCVVLITVAAWPWYWNATANAPVTAVPITRSQTFTIDRNYGGDAGCVGLVDEQQHHWYTASSLRDLVTTNKVTLNLTEFGWTPERHPTQSPSAFLNRPHLNEFGYTLSAVTMDSCQKAPQTGS